MPATLKLGVAFYFASAPSPCLKTRIPAPSGATIAEFKEQLQVRAQALWKDAVVDALYTQDDALLFPQDCVQDVLEEGEQVVCRLRPLLPPMPPTAEGTLPVCSSAAEASAGPTPSLLLFVKFISGHVIAVPCWPYSTVWDLKSRLLEEAGIPLHRQRVLFNGLALHNDSVLHKYGIRTESELYCVLEDEPEPAPSLGLPLLVHDRFGGRLLLPCDPTDTIEVLMYLIQNKTGVAPERQCLIHYGLELVRDKTLSEYQLTPGSSIHLVERHRPLH